MYICLLFTGRPRHWAPRQFDDSRPFSGPACFAGPSPVVAFVPRSPVVVLFSRPLILLLIARGARDRAPLLFLAVVFSASFLSSLPLSLSGHRELAADISLGLSLLFPPACTRVLLPLPLPLVSIRPSSLSRLLTFSLLLLVLSSRPRALLRSSGSRRLLLVLFFSPAPSWSFCRRGGKSRSTARGKGGRRGKR